ncbi:phosphotransferase [Actinacidiphila rubida]|uniref:Phosphotransferase enzyme family protein n=1 Tax=Actinacidiphila rubida TaxID=310780 RepID=A0A1H8MWY0_9ACTN|nr:phosphotransferase [Actinacidiphila rubida]SEO21799.1 Phosphotransferase enzyme family protein [Actinacidiphila rubida]
MSSGQWTTHHVVLDAATVTKRFRRGSCEGATREWRALELLARHAPGLAPVPVRADLTADEPVVVMSRLSGRPLRGLPLGDDQVGALAAAMARATEAVPRDVLAGVPPRRGHPGELIGHVRAWFPTARPHAGRVVGAAMDQGMEWLAGSGEAACRGPRLPGVFGRGDGNPANFLWDGRRVLMVDFEDSGRSDRAFELAEITEHVGSWVEEQPLDVASFLGHFDLTADESAQLVTYRRLLALVWLFLLTFDDPQAPRNPPGTAARQAARLRELLA